MKSFLHALAAAAALFALGAVLPDQLARAADTRKGTVTDLQPIENRGDDESETTQKKRRFGRLIGDAVSMGAVYTGKSTSTVGMAVTAGAGDVGEYAATKIGDQGPTTRYMVKVKLDSGKVLSITQLRQQIEGVKVGSRVEVEGRGDDATVHLAR